MKFKEIYEILKFHLVKLPFIYLLILAGYILEFTVELPYFMVCRFGGKLHFSIRMILLSILKQAEEKLPQDDDPRQ